MSKGSVDADGHVMENDQELLKFVAETFNNHYIHQRYLEHSSRFQSVALFPCRTSPTQYPNCTAK